MSITVSGSKSLQSKFDNLAKVAQGKLLERAVVSGALLIQNDAKRRAPYLTGNLRRSIHIGGHEDLNPGGQGIIDTTGGGVPDPDVSSNNAAVYVGTDVIYAATQEFGRGGIPAQPYLRPAFDTQRGAAVREIGEALLDLIQAAT
jgi:HK97 gp10 family phage protein